MLPDLLNTAPSRDTPEFSSYTRADALTEHYKPQGQDAI